MITSKTGQILRAVKSLQFIKTIVKLEKTFLDISYKDNAYKKR